jgi:hypothetical protein
MTPLTRMFPKYCQEHQSWRTDSATGEKMWKSWQARTIREISTLDILFWVHWDRQIRYRPLRDFDPWYIFWGHWDRYIRYRPLIYFWVKIATASYRQSVLVLPLRDFDPWYTFLRTLGQIYKIPTLDILLSEDSYRQLPPKRAGVGCVVGRTLRIPRTSKRTCPYGSRGHRKHLASWMDKRGRVNKKGSRRHRKAPGLIAGVARTLRIPRTSKSTWPYGSRGHRKAPGLVDG